jgi:hypothetical protein
VVRLIADDHRALIDALDQLTTGAEPRIAVRARPMSGSGPQPDA